MSATPPTVSISESEAARLLGSINHAMPLVFSALTKADTLPGAPEVWKLSSVSAFTGANYEAGVNRRLAKEGKAQLHFTANPRKWGVRTRPALVEHNGGFYLPAFIGHARPVYLMRGEDGLLKIVSKEIATPHLRKAESPRNQGLDRPLIYRDYSVANLVSLSVNRRRYRVSHKERLALGVAVSSAYSAPARAIGTQLDAKA